MIKKTYYILPIRGFIITAILSVLWLCVNATLSAQILTNSDFDSKEEAKDGRTGWVIGIEELPVPLGKGADGNGKSLLLHSDSPNGSHFSQLAPLHPDSLCQYELSFKVKTKSLKKGSVGFVWINLLDADSAMVLETGWGRYEGTKDWTSYSYTFLVPSNTEAIKVGGSITGKGTLWFDDFKLKEVDFKPNEIDISISADQYIKAVIDTMRRNAVNRHKINFDDIYQIIRFNAQGADKPGDTYQAIKSGVRYLIDNHHSNFFTPEEIKKVFGDVNLKEMFNEEGSVYVQKIGLDMDSLKSTVSFSSGKLLDHQIGYLSVASYTNLYLEAVMMYADSIQSIIEHLDQNELKGWVIDLRNNGGGATPPMVVGIGPLLQEDNKAYYANAAQKIESEFYYRNGDYFESEQDEKNAVSILKSLVNYQVKNYNLPIAVLIGTNTASAAEGLATLLAGEPNVKTFGKKTAGLTTGNEFIIFSDNAVLNLSTSYLANRNLVVYEKAIAPDVIVEADGSQDASEDIVLEKAIEWINGN